MENREQQTRFLQPIKDSDRQRDRNPRVFLKAKVIQASSQLNPERDEIFSFPGQQPENPNFGQRNFTQQLRFGEQTDFTVDLNHRKVTFPATLQYLIFQELILQIFGLVVALNQKIPSAADTLGLWRFDHSTRSFQKSPLSRR